jgi:hypothetical protein
MERSRLAKGTLLGWYRELVAHNYDGSKKRCTGRPRIAGEIQRLIVEMARDNPGRDYTRIRDALENPGHSVGRNTIKRVLIENGIHPAGLRGTTWAKFLRAHWGAIAATVLSFATRGSEESCVPARERRRGRPGFANLRADSVVAMHIPAFGRRRAGATCC